MESIIQQIINIAHKQGMLDKQIAAIVGVDPSAISHWKKGRSGPVYKLFEQLIDSLGFLDVLVREKNMSGKNFCSECGSDLYTSEATSFFDDFGCEDCSSHLQMVGWSGFGIHILCTKCKRIVYTSKEDVEWLSPCEKCGAFLAKFKEDNVSTCPACEQKAVLSSVKNNFYIICPKCGLNTIQDNGVQRTKKEAKEVWKERASKYQNYLDLKIFCSEDTGPAADLLSKVLKAIN